MLLPELEDTCTVPVGETCAERVSLDDVVMGGEAVEREEEAAAVCGRAKPGTRNELSTITLARMLKKAIVAGDAERGSKTGKLQVTQDTVKTGGRTNLLCTSSSFSLPRKTMHRIRALLDNDLLVSGGMC